MYSKVNPNLDFVASEAAVKEFWQKNDIFTKSIDMRKNSAQNFSFYDGPPTANGRPHIGHVLTRVFKDIVPRYKAMKGAHVLRKAGWDTHGLPVELEVEKQLGIDGKQQIEKYGIENFTRKCKESVFKYTSEWQKMTNAVGYWVDMENPYITYTDNYIESVWWSIAEIDKKGLLYKGHKVVPYCARCGTSLSSHEVAQGYKDVVDVTCVAKFKVVNKQNTYILAWTTTPWTLPSNVALCVNAEYEYCTVRALDGTNYILAKDLVQKHFDADSGYQIIDTYLGSALEKTEYLPLYATAKKDEKCYYVVCDSYVTLSDGTGVVHIAPAYGEDDSRIGRRYNLPFVQMVSELGKFTVEMPQFEGVKARDADKLIIADLKQRELLYSEFNHTHSYPFCWRCDNPLLYYARSTWFIKMTAVKEQLIKNNNSVNWLPPSIGTGRMGNFLENVVDWGLSRERYWGTPLPIWVCECGHKHVIGSKAELKRLGNIKGDIELHKPFVDEITIDCKCGKKMRRTPEVIDCWYDSGAMPFAQYHYPFENKDVFEKTFPADFISEAVDQTRGWFYTLLAISTLLFDRAPFKNCIVLGHVNDKNGIKMSKHKGNVVDPDTVLTKQGGDAIRWYFYTNSAPYLPSRFYPEAVIEAQRKFLGTLHNVYSFYVLYADIDKYNPFDLPKGVVSKQSLMDKWILSKLNFLILQVDQNLNEYKITESARLIADFCDILSNWYVRRCRERFWGSGFDSDKLAAFNTLYTVLDTFIKLCAPFVPFITESIYQNITANLNAKAPISVHLCDYPVSDKELIDIPLQNGMDIVYNVVENGRAARNLSNIKNRQPLAKIMVSGISGKDVSNELANVIAEELNVKQVEFIDNVAGLISYQVKPQLKTLGSKYGALVNDIRNYLAANGEKVVVFFNTHDIFEFEINGKKVQLTKDDILVSTISKGNLCASSNNGVTVLLDTTLTDELITEGYARELTSKIQTMRKDNGYKVTDKINISFFAGDKIADVFLNSKYSAQIKSDTLALSIVRLDYKDGKEWDINGEKVFLCV